MRGLSYADEQDDYWPAYTDILMVTTVVMLLITVTFVITQQDNRVQAETARRKDAFKAEFERVMADDLRRGWVALDSPKLGERQTITFSDKLLFAAGDARLTNGDGLGALGRVAGLLQRRLAGPDRLHSVAVHGHTDDVAIRTRQFPSNWHLSSARATSVVYFLVQQQLPPATLTAIGHAEFRAVKPDGSPITARNQRRRIELELDYPARWIAAQLEAPR